MSTMTTLAPWTNSYRVEQTIAPVAALRVMGDVCPQHIGRTVPSFLGGAVSADGRFKGTPAWSPPDC